MKNGFLVLALLQFVILCTSVHPETSDLPDISADRLAAHVNFLADDLLEGRGTGTRGYDIAAAYMADQFAQNGVKPAGDPAQKSFLQKVPFRKADVISEQCSVVIQRNNKGDTLKYADDYLLYSDYERERVTLTAPVVFAGFGVTAPHQKYDDYAGIDAKGKIVVIFSGAPEQFPHDERAHFSSSRMKDEMAIDHGAIGILSFRTPEDEDRRPWDRTVRQSKISGYHWMTKDGHVGNFHEQIKIEGSLSHQGAEKVFKGSNFTLQQVFEMLKNHKLKGFDLPGEIGATRVSKLSEATSYNVVGIFEGADPTLKKEYVVYTAHLDHLGIGPAVDGDSIYNGAYDNASGSAALIEIAHAFHELKEPPRRSILFLCVTGEEKGLQGSEYFADFPTVPANLMVADINIDMFLMLFPLADAVIFGQEHSTLGQTAVQAISDAGLKVAEDPYPEEVIFVRSDQYSFVKRGIPSVMLDSGFHSADPKVNGEQLTRSWLKTTYHSPQDDTTQKIYWESGVRITTAAFLTGLRTANATRKPAWLKGDFFGNLYARAEK